MQDEVEDSAGAVVRRAPFSDNPQVGARGLRTQQRILDAALQVFGELGYDRTNIDRITKTAGCSRVAYYQYFSSKEDVFRRLASQVDLQLRASTDALEPVTPDLAGRTEIRRWIERYATVYARYEPVFSAFPAAIESDETLAGGSERVGMRSFVHFQAKVEEAILPPRKLGPVVALLHTTVNRALEVARMLELAGPFAGQHERALDAITDVVHRSLFGRSPVNSSRAKRAPVPALATSVALRRLMAAADITDQHSLEDKPALGLLLAAGHDVFVRRGYHGARIDDIVTTAGVSRGAFYRYFTNRDHLAEILAARALRTLSATFREIPPVVGDAPADWAALRRWLKHYNTVHVDEAAMTRVWVDAALQDAARSDESASALDWGRRRMVSYLADREPFGDLEGDALVMLALIDVFGGRPRPAADVDAAIHVIRHGLYGY